MTHIFASSTLIVSGNPETAPDQNELMLQDGKSIAELIHEKTQNDQGAQGKDDSEQSNRKTLS